MKTARLVRICRLKRLHYANPSIAKSRTKTTTNWRRLKIKSTKTKNINLSYWISKSNKQSTFTGLSLTNSSRKCCSNYLSNRFQLLDLKTVNKNSNSRMKTNIFMKKSSLKKAMTGTAFKLERMMLKKSNIRLTWDNLRFQRLAI